MNVTYVCAAHLKKHYKGKAKRLYVQQLLIEDLEEQSEQKTMDSEWIFPALSLGTVQAGSTW